MTGVADSFVDLQVTCTCWTLNNLNKIDYGELLSGDFVKLILGNVYMSQVNTTQVVRWTHCLTFVVCTIFLELLVAAKALLESACHTYVDWMEDLYGFDISEHVNVDPSNLAVPIWLQIMVHNNGGHLDLLQCDDIESQQPGPNANPTTF